MKCEDCGHEFNYDDPTSNRSYYVIKKRNEVIHGAVGTLAYCAGCAPFGNTKIPDAI